MWNAGCIGLMQSNFILENPKVPTGIAKWEERGSPRESPMAPCKHGERLALKESLLGS